MNNGGILITGTSRGLGRSLADQYLNSGCVVYGCSRNAPTIDHPHYKHFVVDVSDEARVGLMFKDIAALRVPLNLLINNAGISQASLGILTRAEGAADLLRVNLLGTFLVTREALKLMQRQRYGRVVNFSSINVPLASTGSSIYNACKAGIEAMGKSLARECGTADITINTIGLSLVSNSGMLESLGAKAIETKQAGMLKPNILEVDEIIHVIDFFSSVMARNICCQTLYFGGL